MRQGITYGLVGAALALNALAQGEIRLNELMASNTRSYPDVTDFEDYPDWIELHNPSAVEVSLDGYFLSDDSENPYKWAFDSHERIPANGHLIVIADGYDAPSGSTHTRPYWPFRDFVTEKPHTNFKLSSSGETVILSKFEITRSNLIPFGSEWRYLDDGSDQGSSWREPTFDDSGWKTGVGQFGYGDPVATEISYGPDAFNRHITSYYRKDFNVADPSSLAELTLHLIVDDGAAVYLNGIEVARKNLPPWELNYWDEALDPITPDLEEVVTLIPISSELLLDGRNVLAVEVHQVGPGSVDARFDLSFRQTQLINPTEVDRISFGQQVTDVSLGRLDGEWVHFSEATPGLANGGPVVTDLRQMASEVTIDLPGGLYNEDREATLSCAAGEIHFTTDGSEPNSTSPKYDSPLNITETTVLRARCLEPGKIPGPIATRTFFRDQSFIGSIPVLSVVAPPETLFGNKIGIYANDHEQPVSAGPSVHKGKDAPGHLEFFPSDGSTGFAVNGGFRIGGENNWASHLQRALNFALRGKYGDDSLDYDLFPGSGIPRFTALTIREGGDDWGQAHLTDAIFDEITRGRMEVETNKFRPALTFVNGDFWGLYNLRDRWNDNWFFQHYGVNEGEYDRVAFSPLRAEEGSTERFRDFLRYLDDNDVNDPEIWSRITEQMDVDSLIDFVICEAHSRNSSWSGNRELWKAHAPGCKWRWLLPDMDRTFGNTRDEPILGNMWSFETTLSRVKANTQFRERFAQRAAAHLGTTLTAARLRDIINRNSRAMTLARSRQEARWSVPTSGDYNAALSRMRQFVDDRERDFLEEVQTTLGLQDPVDLRLRTLGEGRFRLAGVEMGNEDLRIFPGIDVTLEAFPAPGYRFRSWAGATGEASTTINLDRARTITAVFEADQSTAVSGTLTENTTITPAQSPVVILEDLIIPNGVTLTVEAGVTVELASGQNIRVQGGLQIEGTAESPVTIRGRHGARWGGISFETSAPSAFSHVVVRDATRGADPVTYPSAISGLNSQVALDFIDIDKCYGPFFFRGGTTVLRDSFIHIPVTGDGINVKQGSAETIRCTFLGNLSPDTDAIDYDGVVNGLIKDCRIYRFFGSNSDGIDTGEQCENIVIEGNRIFFNSDKGISVGQGSSIIARNNLIVGCSQGVGVKDTGSTITLDQNTLVDCDEGIAVFEKNFGAGGGEAIVTNSIISGSPIPAKADELSNLRVSYTLSDTIELPGIANLLNEPGFTDSQRLDFSLSDSSVARDSGDPTHAPDPDGSPADRGALYLYDPNDYPFLTEDAVVVNEILSNSGSGSDWIELRNLSPDATDISGWFLSDDASNLRKYRIPANTILQPGQHLAFFEDAHFGSEALDPGRLEGFALSNAGETVHLTSATNQVVTDYRFRQKFGPSPEGLTLGFHELTSGDDRDFTQLVQPTPGALNRGPDNGPLIISEILPLPENGAAEYLELLNASPDHIDLTGWEITKGITFAFPDGTSVAPGERLVIHGEGSLGLYSIPDTTQTFLWTDGRLSNNGERIELQRPWTEPDTLMKADRVTYSLTTPWPTVTSGQALVKIAPRRYGNDPFFWQVEAPTPGLPSEGDRFADWAQANAITEANGDVDQDGRSNLLEYLLGSDPRIVDSSAPLIMEFEAGLISLNFQMSGFRSDAGLLLESSTNLQSWTPLSPTPSGDNQWEAQAAGEANQFFRLRPVLNP